MLLLANLVFFAWAHFVDVSSETRHLDPTARLPRLRLASEAASAGSATSSSSSSAPVPGAPEATPSQSSAAASPTSTPASTPTPAATSTPVVTTTPASTATPMPPSTPSPIQPNPAASPALSRTDVGPRCITVGPFNDGKHLADAVQLFEQRGFKPREHTERRAPERQYWVYVHDLESAVDQQQAVKRLESSGISDATPMPDSSEGRRVSAGLFNERSGAERRATAVRKLGLAASIEERRMPETAHWVDVDLDGNTQRLPMEGLLTLEDSGSRLEIKPCPSRARR